MPATSKRRHRPPFACIALLLQGGGALGAYQAGIYQGMAECELDLEPDWVAGISIGAINAALIAGNPSEKRVERLREFWEGVTSSAFAGLTDAFAPLLDIGSDLRVFFNQASAARAALSGAPGFFEPRLDQPWFFPQGSAGPTSYYDTSPLRGTLERLVDFDRINAREMHFSVGAVNIRSGNFVYFDNTKDRIGPEHIMASGALPPGFPATEIEGEFYWDGGLVSNTPLYWVLEYGPFRDTLAFQVDLWNARGTVPTNMAEVTSRQKEIQYSSRTREATERFAKVKNLRHVIGEAVAKLPPELMNVPEIAALKKVTDPSLYNIVHLIYRMKPFEGDARDYEFSRLSMEEHWRAGYRDMVTTLQHKKIFERPAHRDGVFTFDILRDEGQK
jgi:NTE family protein